MLERLYVDNYRCLVNFECRFNRAQLVLGANGSGKSTLFDVISVLRDFCIGGFQVEYGLVGGTRTRWQSNPTQLFELDVTGNGGKYCFKLEVDSWGSPERLRVVEETVTYSGQPVFLFTHGDVHLFNDSHEEKVTYPFDWHRSALATISDQKDNTKLNWFKRWFRRLLFISPDPRRMSALSAKDELGPARDLSNFAAWYGHLRDESARDDSLLQKELRDVIPGFEFMDRRDAGLGNKYLWFTFSKSSVNGKPSEDVGYGLNELSDGQRVLIGLYTVLHFALKPGVTLFFDEPDNFVALREIQPWLDKVLDQVEDEESNKQAVFISHHPELLNRLACSGGIMLDRPNNWQTRAHEFSDPAQTGLSPSELISRGWEND